MKTRRTFLTAAFALSCTGYLPAIQAAEPTMQQKLDKIILPTVQFSSATIEEAVEYLRVKSRDLDKIQPQVIKGVPFILDIDQEASKRISVTLDLRNIPLGVALKYCVDFAGLKYRVDAHAVMISARPEPSFQPPVLGNARAIIFPTVAFQGATLEEAVEYLRVKSRDLDSTKKGINILLKPGGAPASISLDLSEIPLHEALGYVTDLSRSKLTTDGHAYIITPAPAPAK